MVCEWWFNDNKTINDFLNNLIPCLLAALQVRNYYLGKYKLTDAVFLGNFYVFEIGVASMYWLVKPEKYKK